MEREILKEAAVNSTGRCNTTSAGVWLKVWWAMHVSKRGLSVEARGELRRRWKSGQSLSDVGRTLAKAPGSGFGYVALNGGIPPRLAASL
jgi:hypothetical protein